MLLSELKFTKVSSELEREVPFADIADGSTLQLIRKGGQYNLTLFRPLAKVPAGEKAIVRWRELGELEAQMVLFEVTKDETV